MRRLPLITPLLVVLAMSGCGGGGHHATKQKATVPPYTLHTNGVVHRCDTNNYVMQCALHTPGVGNPPVSLPPVSFRPLQGLDFGWGGPSVAALRSAGMSFAASYFSFDFTKNWRVYQIVAYHQAGIPTVAVWETLALRATGGFAAGRADAMSASQQSRAFGMPGNRPIYFAIDCDCSGSSVAPYFDGINSVIGARRDGAYGGYYPVKYLFDTHRISYGWQTYAWSAGQWDTRAQLEQWSNDHFVGGVDGDFDRAIAVDYGQWPYTAPHSRCFARRNRDNSSVCRARREFRHVHYRSVFHYRCMAAPGHRAHGPNFRRDFCRRLFNIEDRDKRIINHG